MIRGGVGASRSRPLSFAAAVEPAVLVELHLEVMREAQHWLDVWSETRDPVAEGRFYEALDFAKMLVAVRS